MIKIYRQNYSWNNFKTEYNYWIEGETPPISKYREHSDYIPNEIEVQQSDLTLDLLQALLIEHFNEHRDYFEYAKQLLLQYHFEELEFKSKMNNWLISEFGYNLNESK